MESKLKQQCQDSVGELPNLLLREGGYPHLPTTPIKPKSDAWNDAGTKPDHPCLCEVKYAPQALTYRFWNGEFWGRGDTDKDQAIFDGNKIDQGHAAMFLPFTWREVQS